MNTPLMEVYFDKYLLFPYDYLDCLTQEQWAPFLQSAIYFVLKTDKKRIIGYRFEAGKLVLEYKNLRTNRCYAIDNLCFFDFDIPCKYISIEITSGLYVEIGITKNGIEYLSKNDPDALERNDLSHSVKIPLYDLIDASEQNINTIRTYTVQYIGKSKNVKSRLSRHEKIEKILREINLETPDTELFILMYHPMFKLYNGFKMSNYQLEVTTGSSEWQKHSTIGKEMGNHELLVAAEAMLIQYFNPPYNSDYKNTIPNRGQEVFSKLERNGIGTLTLGLVLLLGKCLTISLSSKAASTNGRKMIILSCPLYVLSQNKTSEMQVEEIDDFMFDLIQMI